MGQESALFTRLGAILIFRTRFRPQRLMGIFKMVAGRLSTGG